MTAPAAGPGPVPAWPAPDRRRRSGGRRLPATLAGYLARHFTARLAVLLLTVSAVILLVTTVELLDRSASDRPRPLLDALGLAAMKLPHLTERAVVFVVLFAAMASFWRLTRSHELVVARAAGLSVWQILLPLLAVALALGILTVTLLNPLGSVLQRRLDTLAAGARGSESALSLAGSGIWLREGRDRAAGRAVIHARRLDRAAMTLHDVTIFRYDGPDRFSHRIDAARATLRDGHWQLRDALVTHPGDPGRRVARLRLETALTPRRIENSFARPDTIPVWELPGFIALMERAGFAAEAHRLHLHRLLSLPVLLAAMVPVAATFTLRSHRRGGVAALLAAGVLAGFALHVLSNLIFALGLGSRLPVTVAAWSPAGIALALGLSSLLHLEDG